MASPGEIEQPSTSNHGNLQHLLKEISFRYIPFAGGASSMIFSTNVMAPVMFRRWFGAYNHIISNCLWFNSHLGVGLYLYNRKHIRRASKYSRVIYSVYGALLFNFGTVLFWATAKTLLPQCPFHRVVFGLGSGIAMFYIGREYVGFVDSQLKDELAIESGELAAEE